MRIVVLIVSVMISMYGKDLFLMTEDLKPYNYLEKGELKGVGTEVVEKVLTNLGYEDKTIRVYPWSRALNILETNERAALFSMSYTKERAKKYKFACPVSEAQVFFFVKKGRGLELNSLKDLKSHTIGVVQDFGSHKYLVQQGFKDLDYSSSTKVMVQKLLSGKIDTFVAAPFSVYALDLDISKVEQSKLKLYSTELCIGFNKAFSDSEVKRWQDELEKLRKNGEYRAIYKKYIQKEGS